MPDGAAELAQLEEQAREEGLRLACRVSTPHGSRCQQRAACEGLAAGSTDCTAPARGDRAV